MTRALNGYGMVAIGDVHPSPNNPRERLRDIDELAGSMRELGLIQPIIVQPLEDRPGHFQIVAGHRRHAAATRIGMREVPVIVRRPMRDDSELLAMLVENGQRSGLDPVEEGRALAKLKQQRGLSDTELGKVIGRSQPYVSARLALMHLEVEEQEEVRADQMTLREATDRGRLSAGLVRPGAMGKAGPAHLSIHHPLGARAKARCIRLGHSRGKGKGVGGVACGECWESVIRADERAHLNKLSNDRGRCVLCDVVHDPDANPLGVTA